MGCPARLQSTAKAFRCWRSWGGTLEAPQDWGSYPDRSHYKLQEPDGLRTAHGLLLLHPGGGGHVLLGFTSCRRFDGRIRVLHEQWGCTYFKFDATYWGALIR